MFENEDPVMPGYVFTRRTSFPTSAKPEIIATLCFFSSIVVGACEDKPSLLPLAMITLIFTLPSSSSTLFPLKRPSLSLSRLNHHHNILINRKVFKNGGICRAEFSRDAPFAAAIGASMLSSLLLPNTVNMDEDRDSAIDSTDARLTVMGIISFIPYFNWLSWVFAWLDTGKRRYAVYALVYMAPYLRSNMSLSPEESWLPVASIVLGIIHVQLEASIKNGDIEGFQLFNKASVFLSSMMKKKDINLKEHEELFDEDGRDFRNLPSAEEQLRDEIRERGVSKKPSEHPHPSNGDRDSDDQRKH